MKDRSRPARPLAAIIGEPGSGPGFNVCSAEVEQVLLASEQVEAWSDLPRSKVGEVRKADIKSRLRRAPADRPLGLAGQSLSTRIGLPAAKAAMSSTAWP